MKLQVIAEGHEATRERARRAVRMSICKRCPRRPRCSESLGADVPRACEASCSLFHNLPRLLQTAECVDPMIGSYEHIMNQLIDDLCSKTTTAGRSPRT